MEMETEAITDNGLVVGVNIKIMFDETPKLSNSRKTLIDFSTFGNKELELGDGVDRKLGINIFHKP